MIRQFSDCLVPGPLIYVSRIDAFVTCNYACRAECYRYHALASAQADIGSSAGGAYNKMGLLSIRMALVEWSLNLGEPCRQIVEGKFIPAEKKITTEIVFLCEHSIFLVKDSGGLMQMRRLDRTPLCMSSYISK
jgi:Bardet-Biedl syndrome 9 protein